MKKPLIYLAFAISLTACTDNSVLEIEELQPLPEKEQTANEKAINTYIAKRHPATRSSETTVEPYIVDGDTLMYVADYGDGWEVFSNDTRFPMVIMRSETGKFNINEIASVEPLYEIFENTIDDLKSLKNSSENSIDSSWGILWYSAFK